MTAVFFASSDHPFSNWFRCNFTWRGIDFSSSEQALMYAKACLFDPVRASEILDTDDPRTQKHLGRAVQDFVQEIWEREAPGIMEDILQAKFSHNGELAKLLLASGERQLVEASEWDSIWGIGIDAETARRTPQEEWPGRNLLGKSLEKVRRELYKESAPLSSSDRTR